MITHNQEINRTVSADAFFHMTPKLLLDRMQLLGDGAKEARRRREWAEQAAREEMRERRAQVVSLVQGHNIRRSGFGLLS